MRATTPTSSTAKPSSISPSLSLSASIVAAPCVAREAQQSQGRQLPQLGRQRRPTTTSTSKASSSPRRTATTAAALSISADVAALVAFSALPFLGVQALADSGAGKKLKEDLEMRKPALMKLSAEAERRRREAAGREPRFFGPTRGRWLPESVSESLGERATAPHLPGEVAGDCGFDPLGLCLKRGEEEDDATTKRSTIKRRAGSKQQQRQRQQPQLDQDLFDRYFELELLHARWAMLGALGAFVPEILSLTNLASFPEDRWQFVGRARLQGTDLNYLGVPGLVVAGKQGVAIIAGCQLLLMSGPELARSTGIAALEPLGIFLPGQDKNYPGGTAFDPLNLAGGRNSGDREGERASPAERELRLRVAEAKHGRLAMVAWVVLAAEALAKGEGSKGPLHDFLGAVS